MVRKSTPIDPKVNDNFEELYRTSLGSEVFTASGVIGGKRVNICNATVAATLTLPPVTDSEREIIVINTDLTAATTVEVDDDATETIEYTSSVTSISSLDAVGDTITLYSPGTGTAWYVTSATIA